MTHQKTAIGTVIFLSLPAWAQAAVEVDSRLAALEAATKSAQSAGDNAWMLTSAALVLMMTGPGLALFYGGLVRKKNILATMMQSFAMMALVTVLWGAVGYSLAFGEGRSEEHTPELQSPNHLLFPLPLQKKNTKQPDQTHSP